MKIVNHIFLEGNKPSSNSTQFELNRALSRFQCFWEMSFMRRQHNIHVIVDQQDLWLFEDKCNNFEVVF